MHKIKDAPLETAEMNLVLKLKKVQAKLGKITAYSVRQTNITNQSWDPEIPLLSKETASSFLHKVWGTKMSRNNIQHSALKLETNIILRIILFHCKDLSRRRANIIHQGDIKRYLVDNFGRIVRTPKLQWESK